MKHMLNTLYVTHPESRIIKEGETVIVFRGEEKAMQLPLHTLGQIVCFGPSVYVSPPAMAFCSESGVSIAWLTEGGRFLARVEGSVKGNVLLRRTQYRRADLPHQALTTARNIVAAKINNSRINLLRLQRSRNDADEPLQEGIDKLGRLLQEAAAAASVEVLRGIEGEAAAAYFNLFDRMILQQKETFHFIGRNRRPPLDPVNALLSFLYTLAALDARWALETVGLDPYVGFLHADRPGRPSLALDLMEEFRAPLVDRLALSFINLKQITAGDFVRHGVEVLMTVEGRKKIVLAYQNRKREMIEHPFLKEKMEIGLLFQIQAQLMARHIRGDLDFYPAFVWR